MASVALLPARQRGRAMALWGGTGLLGCLAVFVALSTRGAMPTPPVSVATPAAAPVVSTLRVVAAPDDRHLSPERTKPDARIERVAVASGRSSPAQPMSVSASLRPAPSRSTISHRLTPVAFGESAAFRPVEAARRTAEADWRGARAPVELQRVATLAPAVASAARPSASEPAAEILSTAAAPVEDHVETMLPDIPAGSMEPPTGARAALERELALAIPTPTTRPRRPAAGEPVFGRRHRAPAGLLAYARPDAGSIVDEPAISRDPGPSTPTLSAGTAIYDIAAATVYLPNGERLEAHSGLGSMRDDVRYVREKNRGPTPPHTYNLAMRESLFHGVAAIRLHPVGGQGRIHDRNGLLAHTYMLGPRGDSNGCVSFKDYKRFLAAFKRGEIRRLVVVASLDSPTSRLTSWFGKRKR